MPRTLPHIYSVAANVENDEPTGSGEGAAAVLPPVFSQESGEVEAGTVVTLDLPEGLDDTYYLIYTIGGTDADLASCTPMELFLGSDKFEVVLTPPAKVTIDKETTIKARIVWCPVSTIDGTSDIITKTYTVKEGEGGDEPEEPAAVLPPVFSHESGEVAAGTKVKLDYPVEYSSSFEYSLIYVIDGEDADLDCTLAELNKVLGMGTAKFKMANMDGASIPVGDGVTVKAKMVFGEFDMGTFTYTKIINTSEVITRVYTVKDAGEDPGPEEPEDPDAVLSPVFGRESGEVEAGTVVTLDYPEAYANNLDAYLIYVIDGEDADLENPVPMELVVGHSDKYNVVLTSPERIAISKTTTIKARIVLCPAAIEGMSDIITKTYTVKEGEGGDEPEQPVIPEKPVAPTFSLTAGEVPYGSELKFIYPEAYTQGDDGLCMMAGVMYVQDGTDADLTATATDIMSYGFGGGENAAYKILFADERDKTVEINKSTTVKARVFLLVNANDLRLSDIVSATYTMPKVEVAAPTFSVPAGEVEKGTKVTMACTTDGAKIYYTVTGGNPTERSREYKEAVTIDKDMTLKAMAMVGESKSEVASVTYTIKIETPVDTVAVPTFNPAAGEVEKGTKVEIACATDSVKIYYTVDGSEPTAQSAEYKEAVVIDEALTIKAIAVKGDAKSEVAEAAYTVKTANEDLELAGVSVYPNPSSGAFTLDLPVSATVEVFASNGVLRQRVEAGAGLVTLNIERSGIYFLRITAEGRATVKRVVVR